MKSSNVTFTKDKHITYKQRIFLKTALIKLGVNAKNNGLQLFINVIILAYELDMITINITKICEILALNNHHLKASGINSSLKYSFYNINTKKLIANYQNIFGLEFDAEYFSIKTFVSDFVDLLSVI